MRRTIRKRIRRQADGLDLALDLNADIAINVGGSNQRTTVAREPGHEAGPGPTDPAADAPPESDGKENPEGRAP